MTKEDHILEVVQAFKDGAEIEYVPIENIEKHSYWYDFKDEDGWNFVECEYRIKPKEPARWRAEEGDAYWYIEDNGLVYGRRDDRETDDNMLYKFGNYFRTKEQAIEVRNIIKQALADYHKSIVNSKGSR